MTFRGLLVSHGLPVGEAPIPELDDEVASVAEQSDSYTVEIVGRKVFEYLGEPNDVWDGFRARFVEILHGAQRAKSADATESDAVLQRSGAAGVSWEPTDLSRVLVGDHQMLAPTILRRSDGLALLYRGEVHNFVGESGVGKGWIALYAASQVIRDGGAVLYIDFEDGPLSISGRLRALGISDDETIAQFFYMQPEMPLEMGDAALRFDRTMGRIEPSLVVIDGVTEAMQLHGLDPNSNSEAAEFLTLFPRHVARHACAPTVVMLDHPTKAQQGNHSYALGAQQKRAGIAVTYMVKAQRHIEKGRDDGLVRISVAKDRHGTIQAAGVGSQMPKPFADLLVSANSDGTDLTVALEPSELSVSNRTRTLRDDIRRFLTDSQGASQNQILRGVTGNSEAKKAALREMIDNREIRVEQHGQTRAHYLVSVLPSSDGSEGLGNQEDHD